MERFPMIDKEELRGAEEWLHGSRWADKSNGGAGGFGYHFNEYGLIEILAAYAQSQSSRVQELEAALLRSDSYLSLLRHRAHVPWGSVGFREKQKLTK
jgi:hypothetical protein